MFISASSRTRLEECRQLTTRTGANVILHIPSSPRGVDEPLMRMLMSDDIGRTCMRAVTVGFTLFEDQAPDREQRETFEAAMPFDVGQQRTPARLRHRIDRGGTFPR